MENNSFNHKSVVKFLSVYKDDESLRSYFLRRFDHPDKMSWYDAETSYKLDYLFVDDDNSRKFWIENFSLYSYFYIYALLSKWSEEYDEDTKLKDRCENYLRLYTSQLDDNIVFLKRNCLTIPTSIIAEVGFIIDSYLWLYHTEAPFFVDFVKKNFPEARVLYEKYCRLFIGSLKAHDDCYINDNILHLLDYCKSTDLVVGKQDCYLSLVSQLSTTGSMDNDLSTMIRSVTHKKCSFLTYQIIIGYYCVNCSTHYSNSSVSFCHNSNEINFWVKNKDRYNFLFIYCIAREWFYENQQSKDLGYWCDLFVNGENTAILENEIDLLKKEISNHYQEIPPSIIYNIGFIIDSYWWEKELIEPFLIKALCESSLLTEDIYNHYCKYFETYIKHNSNDFLIYVLDSLLDYCRSTDQIVNNNYCFKLLLEKLSNNITMKGRILEILARTISCTKCIYDFESLKKIYEYYCNLESCKALSSKDIDAVNSIKECLFESRLNEYINEYKKFIRFKELDIKIHLFKELESLYTNDLIYNTWLKFAKPWNAIEYFDNSNYTSFLNYIHIAETNIYSELYGLLNNFMEEIIDNNYDKERAKSCLRNRLFLLINKNMVQLENSTYRDVHQYKKTIIEKSVEKSLNDCQLVPSLLEISLEETSMQSETTITINASFPNKRNKVIRISTPPKIIDYLNQLQNSVPDHFINSFIDAHKKMFGGWRWSCSVPNSRQTEYFNMLHNYIEKCYDLVFMSMIYYLDYEYINYMKDNSKDSEDNSTINISSNSINSD